MLRFSGPLYFFYLEFWGTPFAEFFWFFFRTRLLPSSMHGISDAGFKRFSKKTKLFCSSNRKREENSFFSRKIQKNRLFLFDKKWRFSREIFFPKNITEKKHVENLLKRASDFHHLREIFAVYGSKLGSGLFKSGVQVLR